MSTNDLRLAHHDAGLDRGALCGLAGDVVLVLVIGRSAWVRLPLEPSELGLGDTIIRLRG